jgi:hypothetical protein
MASKVGLITGFVMMAFLIWYIATVTMPRYFEAQEDVKIAKQEPRRNITRGSNGLTL